MDGSATLVLRVIHILCGVYWAGALLFVATFLEPSVRAAGPDGAKVMQGIMQRRFLDIMPAVALVTILTGLELYRKLSGGFDPTWMGSAYGASITGGAVAALVAFAIGVGVMRPAAKRVGPLAQSAQGLPEGSEREACLAEVQRLRRRSAIAGRWVATLLAVAVIGMAAARYV
jgi:uncharacterized membrane protein